jgi:hypothetical protein
VTTTGTPTQLMLPGQAAAPEGPVDLVGMWVMHHAFRRDLAAFADAVAATPVQDRATWRALEARWGRFADVLHHHHSAEDAGLWPGLRERAGVAGAATLDAMQADHEAIDPLMKACALGFAALAAGAGADARAALVVRISAAREALLRHLAAEESQAMPMVQAHLTRADWERMEAEHFKPAYPPREIPWTLSWAMHGLPAAARRRLAGSAGPVLLLVWKLVLRRTFERGERRAFRYRTAGPCATNVE